MMLDMVCYVCIVFLAVCGVALLSDEWKREE